jgi:hypothetical protein
MAQVSGKYDHPAYLAVDHIDIQGVAGASGTTGYKAWPNALRLRGACATIQTAGTTTGAASSYIIVNGTTPIGTTVFGTSAKGVVVTISDLNSLLPANTTLSVVTGTDATVVAVVTIEKHIDPSGTWTGPG